MTDISSPPDPRRRMRELLAIPERDRSDAQWDELIELEISMAPGNRENGPDANARRNGPAQGGERKPAGDRRSGGERNKPAGGGQRAAGDRRPGGAPRPPGAAPKQSGDRRPPGQPRSGGERRPAAAPRPVAEAQPAAAEQNPIGAIVDATSAPAEAGAPAKKPFRKFHKRPPKADVPES